MLRALASIFLSLVLLFTSHGAAMAHRAPHAVDQMVICVGATAVIVYVDDEGQPVEAPHLCPDCALHLLAALVPPIVQSVAPMGAPRTVLYPVLEFRPGATWAFAPARAPPFDVI